MGNNLADGISFIANSTGTGTFIFGSPRPSFLTTAQGLANGVLADGQIVSYLAQDSLTNPTQREWGHGTFSSSGNSIARTKVLGGSAGPGVAVNFAIPPTISLTALAEDILGYGVNILTYGGVGDGATDNTAALTAAYAALKVNGGTIYFPMGKYHFSSTNTLTFPATDVLFSLSIVGDGADASVLSFASGQGLVIRYNSNVTAPNNQSSHFRDIAITTLGTTGVGTGITLQQIGSNNGSFAALSDLTRVAFRGDDSYTGTMFWGTCLAVVGISNVDVDGCMFQSINKPAGTPVGGGVTYNGINASNVATVMNFNGCTFNSLNVGFNYGDNIQGMAFTACNFTGCKIGINIAAGLSNIGAQLCVEGCQFGVFGNANGIVMQTGINCLLITNSLFLLNAASSGGVVLTAASNTTIVGNEFQCAGSTASITGISIGSNPSNTGIVIADNVFAGMNGSGSLPISVGAGANNVILANNPTIFCNNIVNNSTGGFISTMQNNVTTGNFAFAMFNMAGAPGCDGLAVRAGSSTTTDSTTSLIAFANANAAPSLCGTITRNGTNTVNYGTSSDARLKNRLRKSSRGLDILRQIDICDFEWKDTPGKVVQGFIAQDLYKHYPEAVHVGGDDPDKNPWATDYGRLTPLLARTILELEERVEELERSRD
jgi:hypothetical protein